MQQLKETDAKNGLKTSEDTDISSQKADGSESRRKHENGISPLNKHGCCSV
jgi:hypothetical protein